DLRGNLERQPDASRNLDRPVEPLFRGNAANEGEVAAMRGPIIEQSLRDAMVHRCKPVRVRERTPLASGDRYQREFRPAPVDAWQVDDVEAPVQRGQGSRGDALEQGKVQQIHMKMNHV